MGEERKERGRSGFPEDQVQAHHDARYRNKKVQSRAQHRSFFALIVRCDDKELIMMKNWLIMVMTWL